MSRFDGYRVYNGCPDSTMQRRLDAEQQVCQELIDQIQKYLLNVSVTYFPAPPSGYLVFSNHKEIGFSENPHRTKQQALLFALKTVKGEVDEKERV